MKKGIEKHILQGVVGGCSANAANVLVLKIASIMHIMTARGGLLKFLYKLISLLSGSEKFPAGRELLFVSGHVLSHPQLFHWVTGMVMALSYSCWVVPAFPGSATQKSLIFGVLIWFVNSAIVLPIIGEGFAGAVSLKMAGIIWFALAHYLFFLVLGVVCKLLD